MDNSLWCLKLQRRLVFFQYWSRKKCNSWVGATPRREIRKKKKNGKKAAQTNDHWVKNTAKQNSQHRTHRVWRESLESFSLDVSF